MTEEIKNLRKVLSTNVKRQRESLGLTQEKLAERAGISANMINDIEGCRTWVSDRTLTKLAAALKTEIYSFFIPASLSDDDRIKIALTDLACDLRKVKKDYDNDFEKALKLRGLA